MGERLQAARDEYDALEKNAKAKENPQFYLAQGQIDVDNDARQFAWAYLVVRKGITASIWLAVSALVFYALYWFGRYSLDTIPGLFGRVMTG